MVSNIVRSYQNRVGHLKGVLSNKQIVFFSLLVTLVYKIIGSIKRNILIVLKEKKSIIYLLIVSIFNNNNVNVGLPINLLSLELSQLLVV